MTQVSLNNSNQTEIRDFVYLKSDYRQSSRMLSEVLIKMSRFTRNQLATSRE